MKMRLRDVLEINRGLEELGQVKMLEDGKLSYRLAKLRRDIAEELKLFDATRKSVIERLGHGEEIKPGTPEHKSFTREIEQLLEEQAEVFWIPVTYDSFNPKNRLKLSEDFLFLTFPLWSEPEEPKPEEPPK